MNMTKLGILLALTFLAGGATGYLVAKKLLEDKQEEYEEINPPSEEEDDKDLDDIYNGMTEDEIEESKEHFRKVVTNYKKPDLGILARMGKNTEKREKMRSNYNAEADLTDDEIEEAGWQSEDMAAVDNDEPYMIDYEEYANENEHYDKIDVYYYRFDDVVCDSGDEIIEDSEELLGFDVFKWLETHTTGFVRNEKIHSDFEIHTLSKSYAVDVQARAETDRERELRRMARKKEAVDAYADDENEE